MQVSIKIKKTNIDKLLKEIIVIYSTLEQQNQHILDYFDKQKIQHKKTTMKTCDYSAMILKNDELGLPYDITLEPVILIERKNSLEELSSNIANGRETFRNEWIRAKESGANLYLVVESGSFSDIDKHNYNARYNEKAFYNTLLSWQHDYNFKMHFVTKELIGKHILRLLQIQLKKLLEE